MRRISTAVGVCLALGLLLATCGPSSPAAEVPGETAVVPSPTLPKATIAPTGTPPPPVPTPTPVPPTGTPLPPQPTPTPTLSPPSVTHISIDGDPADWAGYEALLSDEEGDTFQGGFDLKSVRAFTNDQYFYLMLDAYAGIGDYVQVDLDIDADGDGKQDYMATFRPRTGRRDLGDFTSGEEVWGPLRAGLAAEGSVVEFKMPLGLLAGREAFTLMRIRVMNGECCDQAWYVVDDTGPVAIVRAHEREMTLAEGFDRWLSSPFEGIASAPFVINDTHPALAGARGLVINQAETTAYIIGEFSAALSQVDIHPASPTFGQATVIASNLLRPNGLAVNRAETVAYVTTEIGYDRTGVNRLVRVNLATGEAATVTDQMGQPTNIALSRDETQGYVVDLQWGGLYRVKLDTGGLAAIATGLNSPYPVAVNRAETLAYVVTQPARAGDYSRGDLLRIDLLSGQVSSVTAGAILGASGITLSADERQAFVTEFGHEGGCDGSLSAVNIDPDAADFGQKTVLVSGLCGAHDVQLNTAETLIYWVEVDASRLSVIRVNR